MILTKSIYETPSENDGTRILVMRKWPRGISWDIMFSWAKNLSPCNGLLSDWKKELITWMEYEIRFINEMKLQKSNVRLLAKRSQSGETITLLCSERENDPYCHRHILKRLIDNSDTINSIMNNSI